MLFIYYGGEVLLSKGIFDKIVELYRELSNLGMNFMQNWKLRLCYSVEKVMSGSTSRVYIR